jgi:hypothetical protein
MRAEYDFSGGVRGKYVDQYRRGVNVVLLEPELVQAFPDSKSVNDALRALLAIATRAENPGAADSTRCPATPAGSTPNEQLTLTATSHPNGRPWAELQKVGTAKPLERLRLLQTGAILLRRSPDVPPLKKKTDDPARRVLSTTTIGRRPREN